MLFSCFGEVLKVTAAAAVMSSVIIVGKQHQATTFGSRCLLGVAAFAPRRAYDARACGGRIPRAVLPVRQEGVVPEAIESGLSAASGEIFLCDFFFFFEQTTSAADVIIPDAG